VEYNSVISGIKEAKMEELPEIIKTLKEMREACAACFRVISNNESMVLLLDAHLKEIGVEDGFGVRCQDLIEKLEQKGGKMKTHELKCWPEFFEPILTGEKTFELRDNDRGFRAGDLLRLMEWIKDDGYTGREITVEITYILSGLPWLQAGYVAMAIKKQKGP
jgi:uncharacterized protein YqfB (UPF0267 family)